LKLVERVDYGWVEGLGLLLLVAALAAYGAVHLTLDIAHLIGGF
jgi:hypothetical protein